MIVLQFFGEKSSLKNVYFPSCRFPQKGSSLYMQYTFKDNCNRAYDTKVLNDMFQW